MKLAPFTGPHLNKGHALGRLADDTRRGIAAIPRQ